MKKSTKLLISATVVASLIGVGSVSYAIWTTGSNLTQEASGITGSIRTIGNMTVTPSTKSGTLAKMNALYPVDQGGSYLNYWEFTLSAEVTADDSSEDGTAMFKLAGTLSPGSSGVDVKSAALYWSASVPTETIGAVPANKLSETAVTLEGLTDNKVYVYMVASGTDAMKAKINLTFSAE